MNIQFFFPTAICSIKNVELAEQMLPITKKYLENKNLLTNHWGYKTTYNNFEGLEKYTDFNSFIKIIKKYSVEYMHKLGYNIFEDELIVRLFASEMEKGDEHAKHTHQNSCLSGVFYLQIPSKSSDIIFYDPRAFRRFVEHTIKQETEVTWQQVYFKPEKGLLLLWESWIEHEVPKNNSEDKRITLVFNVGKRVIE